MNQRQGHKKKNDTGRRGCRCCRRTAAAVEGTLVRRGSPTAGSDGGEAGPLSPHVPSPPARSGMSDLGHRAAAASPPTRSGGGGVPPLLGRRGGEGAARKTMGRGTARKTTGRGAGARPLDGGALTLGRVRTPGRRHAPAPLLFSFRARGRGG